MALNKHVAEVLEKRRIDKKYLDKYKVEMLDWDELYEIAKEIAFGIMYKKIYKKIVILYDPDVDGLYSGYNMEDYLLRIKVPKENIFRFMNKDKVHGYSEEFIEFIKENNIDLVIVVDAGSSDTLKFYEAIPDTRVLILDHHEYEVHDLPVDNKISKLNVKDYPHLPSLSGCGVVYRFIEAMNTYFEIPIKMYEIYVGITVISDSCSMVDNENRYYVQQLYNNNEYNDFLKAFKNIGFYGSNMSLFAFKLIPYLNAMIRIGEEQKAMEMVNDMNNSALKNYIALDEKRVKDIQAKEVEKIIEMSQMVEGDGFVALLRQPQNEMTTLNGLVANKLMGTLNKSALVMAVRKNKEDKNVWKGSFRGFDYTNAILEPYGFDCRGHDKACGVSILPQDLREFVNTFNYIPEFSELYDIEMSLSELTNPETLKGIAEFNEFASGDLKNIVVKITDDFGSHNASKKARGNSGKFNIISFNGQEIVDFTSDSVGSIESLLVTVNFSSFNPYQIVRVS